MGSDPFCVNPLAWADRSQPPLALAAAEPSGQPRCGGVHTRALGEAPGGRDEVRSGSAGPKAPQPHGEPLEGAPGGSPVMGTRPEVFLLRDLPPRAWG